MKLFSRFLNETGPSVEWSKIEPLPPGTVSADKETDGRTDRQTDRWTDRQINDLYKCTGTQV